MCIEDIRFTKKKIQSHSVLFSLCSVTHFLVPLILFPTVLYFVSTRLPHFITFIGFFSFSLIYFNIVLFPFPWILHHKSMEDTLGFFSCSWLWQPIFQQTKEENRMTKKPVVLVLVGRIKPLLITLKLSTSCLFLCAWIILFVMLFVIQEEKQRLNMLFPRLIK